ncbi:hypothetical protein JYK14_06750 [Siccirubricoccus sp. KC 17139]|uniref:Uncharacterized protein n=1 Tax=Siccirubricoccus soli TaxID=2899147 RepID=A0ABT1D3T8_9PROT|nr:hypothetical protein [Siccirubricoccus soli]MCO6415874.1 hypothetical protein [Siccirubricoccus soli]MCP2682006.1 hypothetical protein [Siccirubricoccus soli]
MPVPTSDDLLRPALMLLAYDNEGSAGDHQTFRGVLDEAYAAARVVFPVVRIDVRLWVPEMEASAIGRGVSAGNWHRDDAEPGCVIIDVEGTSWQYPEGVTAISTMGTFVGLAASIVAARLMREEELGAAMLARVLAATRAILEARGVDPRTIRQADRCGNYSAPLPVSDRLLRDRVAPTRFR